MLRDHRIYLGLLGGTYKVQQPSCRPSLLAFPEERRDVEDAAAALRQGKKLTSAKAGDAEAICIL